ASRKRGAGQKCEKNSELHRKAAVFSRTCIFNRDYLVLAARPAEHGRDDGPRLMWFWIDVCLFRLNHLELCRNQTRRIDPHPSGGIEPALLVARRPDRSDVSIGNFGEIAYRARRIKLRRPKEARVAGDLVLGHEAVGSASRTVV